MDDFLRAHLQDVGVIAGDGIGRRVRATACTSCLRRTLTGLDADRAGIAVHVDSAEIDRIGEVLAAARGVRTYTLRYVGGRWELDYRLPIEMQTFRRWPVFAGHRCDVAYPPVDEPHPKIARLQRKRLPDVPPF